MARPSVDRTSQCRIPLDLPPVDLLMVPSDIPESNPPPQWLPAGTEIRAGDLLFTAASQAHATPVAPGDGVLGTPTPVRIVGGRRVHAVEFRPQTATRTETASFLDTASSLDAPPPILDPTSAANLLSPIVPADFADWLTRIHRAGIWADRWTCPDLLGQLRDALSRPIDTLICNLLDSDPWLPMARVAASAWPLELATGLGLLGQLTGAANWWALTDQADDTSGPLRQAAAAVAGQLRIAPVENDYPQLDPTLLVKATTGRRLKPGRRPTSLGILLIDAPAAIAIGRMVLSNAAMTRVPLVLYDQAGDASYAFSVPPGTSVASIARRIGMPSAVREIYAGGPLRQVRVADDDVIGGGELTLFAAPPQPVVSPAPCVRCGWCIETCPTRCRPAGILEAAQLQDAELARHNGIDACIECGLCTFVCPSRLPLLEGIRHIRKEMATTDY